MVHTHQHSCEEGTRPLTPLEAKKNNVAWALATLVWQLLGIPSQGATEGIMYSPVHHRG